MTTFARQSELARQPDEPIASAETLKFQLCWGFSAKALDPLASAADDGRLVVEVRGGPRDATIESRVNLGKDDVFVATEHGATANVLADGDFLHVEIRNDADLLLRMTVRDDVLLYAVSPLPSRIGLRGGQYDAPRLCPGFHFERRVHIRPGESFLGISA